MAIHPAPTSDQSRMHQVDSDDPARIVQYHGVDSKPCECSCCEYIATSKVEVRSSSPAVKQKAAAIGPYGPKET